MAIRNVITIDEFTPELYVGSSEITTGFDAREGYYELRGSGELAVVEASFWIVRPGLDADDDFISIRNLPYHDSTIDFGGEDAKADGVFTNASLLSGSDAHVWPRMRLDISGSHCYINDNPNEESGRNSWTFTGHGFFIRGWLKYPVDIS